MKKSDIFKALAIIGVGATAYMTAKAMPYVEGYYEEWIASKNFADDDSEKFEADIEFVKKCAKAFMPAILAGASTIISILMLDKSHIKQQAAVMAQLYSAKKLIDCVKDQAEEENIEIRYDFSDYSDDILKKKVKKDEIIVYEPYTDQIFTTTKRLIEKAEEKGNKRLNNYYFETLNRFIKDIGGKPCPFGDTLGWSCEKDYQMDKWQTDGPYLAVKLSPQDVDGRTVYVMDYDVNPLWL